MESLCRAYAENFGLHVAIVRMFSVYGAGLEKQLVWDLCGKLAVAGDSPVVLGGTGRELRDWLHVSDAAALLWLARAQCDGSCPVVNGGTGIATSIREVAGMVCEAWVGALASNSAVLHERAILPVWLLIARGQSNLALSPGLCLLRVFVKRLAGL